MNARDPTSLIDALRDVLPLCPPADPRLPLGNRGISLQFLRAWYSALELELGVETAKSIDCFHIVGEKSIETDDWLASAPTIKLPSSQSPEWSIRFLTGTTSLSLVETMVVAAEITGNRSFTHDERNRPYFIETTHS